MSGNAKRRRTLKLATQTTAPRTLRPAGETKTIARLRKGLAQCTSRQQLEEIIRQAPEGHRVEMRDLIYRLAPPNLPCCHLSRVSKARGDVPVQHGRLCPVGGVIVVPA
jgi:hypothetical protein